MKGKGYSVILTDNLNDPVQEGFRIDAKDRSDFDEIIEFAEKYGLYVLVLGTFSHEKE